MGTTWARLRAVCGLAGPAAFTLAWAVSAGRQPGYSVANEHISGLAAPDAQAPWLMTAGFASLGAATIVFASQLEHRLGGADRAAGPGPSLLGLSGLATISAGILRRDRMSNYPMPGAPARRPSWRNDGHDVASVLAQLAAGTGMLALAARVAGEPGWRDLAVPLVAGVVASSGLMAIFARDVTRPGNGIVQRIGISIPAVAVARVAWRLLSQPEPPARPS